MKTKIRDYALAFLLVFLLKIAADAQPACGFEPQRDPQIEQYTEGYVRNFLRNAQSRTVARIPVVFHIVWQTAAENVSDAEIQTQLAAINRDFRKRNADMSDVPINFARLAADCEIEFCLAQRDVLGRLTTGVVRQQTNIQNIGSEFADSIHRKIYYSEFNGDNAWNPSNYLNIWVCSFDGGINGLASSPAKALQRRSEDGVVIDYRVFGSGSREGRQRGRTLVHEIGHYFNLLHIWGSDDTCNDDDEVEDTPQQAAPSSGCPSFPKSSGCGNNGGSMFMNFMDYSFDECSQIFSAGQKARMWATLTGFRADLLRGLACEPVTATADIAPEWSVSPNPARSILTIQLPSTGVSTGRKVVLQNAMGQILLEKAAGTEGVECNVSTLPNGLYFVTLVVGNQRFMKKIIILK